jgi:hypothetical protein
MLLSISYWAGNRSTDSRFTATLRELARVEVSKGGETLEKR